VDRVYPFAELPAAAAQLQANAHVGKIVVKL
jgi:NADPH:quinone reductase-like Zn-dependent oxidoreductase